MGRKQRSAGAKDKREAVNIRRARSGDAERIAELCGQLGYPATTAQIAQRLRRIKPAEQHAVLVAETPEGKVIGWLHVSVEPLLEVELRAEVNGLVVADEARSRGAGALLLQSAEEWARRRGCKNMSVRSNVVRERAHQFYLRNGYQPYKTQKSFRKAV